MHVVVAVAIIIALVLVFVELSHRARQSKKAAVVAPFSVGARF
jgi:uncharacterized membrane protein